MLKVKNLKASIGEVEILKEIDLEIGNGELHAVMGPNGSGKSTLCHVLMGNTDYKNEGECLAEGEDSSCGPGTQLQLRSCVDGSQNNCK